MESFVYVLLEDGDVIMHSSVDPVIFAVLEEEEAKRWVGKSDLRGYSRVYINEVAEIQKKAYEEWKRKLDMEAEEEIKQKEEREVEFQKFIEASGGKPVPVEDIEEFLSRIPPCDEDLLPKELSSREKEILEGKLKQEDELHSFVQDVFTGAFLDQGRDRRSKKED